MICETDGDVLAARSARTPALGLTVSIPRASVIVRARDEERTIGRTLTLLERQTVPPEIIVVDSGSTDDTVRIAAPRADILLTLEPQHFTYGRALNVGADAASAPTHFAVSAHCFPERADWIERSLALYERGDVAATGGMVALPDGRPARETVYQDAAVMRANPRWGFSNHASSWRASVWDEFRFDEEIDAGEDKEWAWRVLHAGWVIAYDTALWVDMSHQWRTGIRASFRRQEREARGLRTFLDLPPYGLPELLTEWWYDMPAQRRRPAWTHRFLNLWRHARLLGKYRGSRKG